MVKIKLLDTSATDVGSFRLPVFFESPQKLTKTTLNPTQINNQAVDAIQKLSECSWWVLYKRAYSPL